jgi:hypothetical protein
MNLPKFDANTWLGGIVTPKPIRAVGFILHLALGVVWMVAYAAAWQAGIGAPDVTQGILAGVIHWLIGGAILGVTAPLFASARSGAFKAPGVYLRELGSMGFIAGLMPHIIYGMTVGLVYQLFV